jgi:hypothetical protein
MGIKKLPPDAAASSSSFSSRISVLMLIISLMFLVIIVVLPFGTEFFVLSMVYAQNTAGNYHRHANTSRFSPGLAGSI